MLKATPVLGFYCHEAIIGACSVTAVPPTDALQQLTAAAWSGRL
jgi:hypothetical protein